MLNLKEDFGIGIRGKLGLVTPAQKAEYSERLYAQNLNQTNKRILHELKHVDANIITDFIIKAKNFFEQQDGVNGRKYKVYNACYRIPKYDDNQNLIFSYLLKRIIAPEDKEQELETIILQEEESIKRFENLHILDPYVESINGLQFVDNYSYCLYCEDGINPQLIKFDPRFRNLIARLIKVRFERPELSLEFTMQLVLNELVTGKTITDTNTEVIVNSNPFHNLSLHFKNALKLYMTPQQEEELRQRQVLKRFESINPELLNELLITTQSLLTGIEYVSAIVVIIRETQISFEKPMYMRFIVPKDKKELVEDKWVFYEPGNQRDIYEGQLHLRGINYFNFDPNKNYEMYNILKGLDPRLIKFNPQFEDIFKDLVRIFLEQPNISMEDAKDEAIACLKKRIAQKQKCLTRN